MNETDAKNDTEHEQTRVIERPDGFYWVDEEIGREYGPFSTLLAAMQDMQGIGESDFGEGVPLQEAEAEIGITDWIDPDTREPGEEHAPRLAD